MSVIAKKIAREGITSPNHSVLRSRDSAKAAAEIKAADDKIAEALKQHQRKGN